MRFVGSMSILQAGAWLCRRRRRAGIRIIFPGRALDIVRAVPRLNKGDHVFAVDARGGVDVSHGTPSLRRSGEAGGLSDVRLHDLRRTVMTNAAAAGVGTHVLRDLLGHKTTAMAGSVRALGMARRSLTLARR